MKYKICQVIFSTNRLEYLIPTLGAQSNLIFDNCEVHKIFIDDYPNGRNDCEITDLVKFYGYDEIILHSENQGLSVTWSEFWDLIKYRNYDYVWHQEDDVVVLEPVQVSTLIEILERDPQLSQIRLARQAWYNHEKDPKPLETDFIWKNFRYNKNSVLFSPMASIYDHRLTRVPYRQIYDHNLNEGMIGNILYQQYGLITGEAKNSNGKNLVEHIGDWFVGKRVLPGEPGYEIFKQYDPDKRYNSKNGAEYKE